MTHTMKFGFVLVVIIALGWQFTRPTEPAKTTQVAAAETQPVGARQPASVPDAGTELLARSAINKKGHACAQVTSMEAIGMVESGDALIGAFCSDGNRWVLRYNSASNRIVNVLECWALEYAGTKLPFCQ